MKLHRKTPSSRNKMPVKMLVVIVVSGDIFSLGGIQHHIREFLNIITQMGITVLLVYRKGFIPKFLLVSRRCKLRVGRGIYSEPTTSFLPGLPNIVKFFTFVLYGIPFLLWKLRNYRPSLIHCHDTGYAGLVGMIMSAIMKVPFIVHIHGTFALSTGHGLAKYNHYENVIGKLVAQRADAIITVSDYLINYYKSLGVSKANTYTIPMGVDLKRFNSGESGNFMEHYPNREAVVVYVGRLSREKNIPTLLQAFAILRDMGVKVKLWIVGIGPEEQELRRLSKKLGLSETVKFLGYRRDVDKILASADIFVLPSVAEGSPNSLLEAMAVGKPVVSSDIPSIRYIVTHEVNGLLSNPHKPKEIANQIVRLVENYKLRDSLGRAARESVSMRFDAKEQMRKILEVYDLVIAGRCQ